MTKKSPTMVTITPEIRDMIARAEADAVKAIDSPALSEPLRNEADAHTSILRYSQEQGGKRVYR